MTSLDYYSMERGMRGEDNQKIWKHNNMSFMDSPWKKRHTNNRERGGVGCLGSIQF